MKIEMTEVSNGYIVNITGVDGINKPYVFKATEILQMLEFAGKPLYGTKIKVVAI